jgi:hypothetical protein
MNHVEPLPRSVAGGRRRPTPVTGVSAGYRLPNGIELGVGPNVSVRKEGGDPTTSMVMAGRATLPFGELYAPINLAVAFAQGGPRITALIGWIIG